MRRKFTLTCKFFEKVSPSKKLFALRFPIWLIFGAVLSIKNEIRFVSINIEDLLFIVKEKEWCCCLPVDDELEIAIGWGLAEIFDWKSNKSMITSLQLVKSKKIVFKNKILKQK